MIGVRIALSIRLRACAHLQSLEALLVWMCTQQKLFLQASFDFFARRFLDLAPPTMAAPQSERRSDWFAWPTRQRAGDDLRGTRNRLWHFAGGERADRAIGVLEYVGHYHLAELFYWHYLHLPQFTDSCRVLHCQNLPTGFAILLIMLPQSNVPSYQTQLPTPTATSDVQERVYRLFAKFSRATGASSFDHTMLVSISPPFHDKFRTLLSTIHQAYGHSKLSAQPTLTEVPTIPGLSIL